MEIPDDLITQSDAAKIRSCSRQAIQNLVEKGRIPEYRIAGICFIRKRDVDEFRPTKSGRPKKILEEIDVIVS